VIGEVLGDSDSSILRWISVKVNPYIAAYTTIAIDGIKHVEEIIELIFHAIAMIQRSGPLQWVHDELRQLNEQKFRFKVPILICIIYRIYLN
jgi:secreted Zn-dependent insulinase-like peptidase